MNAFLETNHACKPTASVELLSLFIFTRAIEHNGFRVLAKESMDDPSGGVPVVSANIRVPTARGSPDDDRH